MHPKIFAQFDELCGQYQWKGRVLEVGTIPNHQSLLNMNCLSGVDEKLGLDLNGPFEVNGINVIQGNANCLPFEDESFDGVLCHAVIEHDPMFWKTVSEAKRVTKSGGLVVFGGPAFVELPFEGFRAKLVNWTRMKRWVRRYGLIDCLVNSTLCFRVHAAPGDYYRFGQQAFRDVILDGLEEVETRTLMTPPRIIGLGKKPVPAMSSAA